MATRAPRSRREELLSIAGDLFARHGYSGTSIRQIAGTADLQSATLYGHFRSKAAIFRELAERYFDELLPRLEAIVGSTEPADQRLERMVRTAVDVGLHHRPAFIALSNDWTVIQSTTELAELVQRRNRASALWLGVVNDALAVGSIDPSVDPVEALWILYAVVTGMVDDRYQGVAAVARRPPVDLLLEVLASGLWRRSDDG